MRKTLFLFLALGGAVGCDGGGKGDKGGAFRLIQFLEDDQANISRNHEMTFLFSEAVRPGQDFAQRLKIQSVETQPDSDFTLAIGNYVLNGDRVTFKPRLPNLTDRSDAGFRSDTNYVVFLKGGPDALESVTGNRISLPQQFTFNTSQYFEDPSPTQPPRVVSFVAHDPISNATTDLSRLDPRPTELALLDSASLIAGQRFVDPGAGGPPNFTRPWQFELIVSEPVDPITVITSNIQMFEIFSDATTTAPEAPPGAAPGYTGSPVNFKVPLNVQVQQGFNAQGDVEVRIIAIPVFTLVDDTRYRITFSGSILGIDFRKEFTGENGLTGDGQTVLSGAGIPYAEPGGLGYTTEFIVSDRSAITQKRVLTYDPLVDGVDPELGQTVADKARYNSALYNPVINPSTAVGFLSAFGQGVDGNLAVTNGILTINTGDTVNAPVGTFTVQDLNPTDLYHSNPLPGGPITYNNPAPFELQLQSLTVSAGATLRFIGKNPPILRVRGIAQIAGRIDIAGVDGVVGGGTQGLGGAGSVAGFAGGLTKRPGVCTGYCPGGSNDFQVFLSACSAANANQPHSLNGTGPGRGYAGGTSYTYDYSNDLVNGGGTGGGGASHATKGSAGEDIKNASQGAGSAGLPCDTCGIRNDGVVGVRGQSGPTYGDRQAAVILLGGSGGGGGGSVANWNTPKTQAGGSGGGGGGSISIIAAGAILVNNGTIDAHGGNGGAGRIISQSQPNNWHSTSGGGGGGAGGLISLISGDVINVTGALLDARGGVGGARSSDGTSFSCTVCNAGGAGGKGFIFLMDADGTITGMNPAVAGNYDNFSTGVLTISLFDTSRFSSIAAVTELFPALAADPTYQTMVPGDVLGFCNANQRIRIFASSARADATNPLLPNMTTETAEVAVALCRNQSGATVVDILGPMTTLNTPGRDAFARIDAKFEYDNGVEAALGPFAYIDRVDLTVSFNG